MNIKEFFGVSDESKDDPNGSMNVPKGLQKTTDEGKNQTTDFMKNLRLGIDAANASIQVALVNALATADWGAYGDLIDILKYSIQFMVFILYVNVGFTAGRPAPNIKYNVSITFIYFFISILCVPCLE